MTQPTYTHERNYGCRITETIYRGLRTVTLENETIRVTVLADKGSDIIEFLHKPTDTDFMWRSPQGVQNPATFVPTVARADGAFLDYYEGGWQECLPTGGGPAEYGGASFGAHGEVCLIPWAYAILEDQPERVAVRFRVRTYRTPLFVEKTLSLTRHSGVLTIDERLLNEGDEPIDLVWGHHPAFGPPFVDASCVVDLPGARVRTTDISPTTRYRPGDGYVWPHVPGRDGRMLDISRIAEPSERSHDTVFLSELAGGWYALTNTARQVGFAMTWPAEVFGAIWFWQVYGGALGQPWYGRTYNIAIEPWTTPETTVGAALAAGSARRLHPGQALQVTLRAVAYAGVRRVADVLPDGQIVAAEP
jgi:hypothetical protein